MKRDRITPLRNQGRRVGEVHRTRLTDEELDALARAHGSRLIRQAVPGAAPLERNPSTKGDKS